MKLEFGLAMHDVSNAHPFDAFFTEAEIKLRDGRSTILSVPKPGDPLAGGFVFGMYKAGSTLLQNAVEELCGAAGVPCYNIVNEARRLAGIAIEREELTGNSRHELEAFFSQRGIVFIGFRECPTFIDIRLGDAAAVLLVRDPRDMLTSQYFSLKFSHVIGPENIAVAKARARLASVGIDDFVLQNSANALRWFSTYEQKLAGANLMLRRYEDIIFSKNQFFTELCSHLGLDVQESRIAQIADRLDLRPAQEDLYQHVRRVVPGDHREKLYPETVEKLNDIFSSVLRNYGYR